MSTENNYEFMDKLPHDTVSPVEKQPAVVDLVLPMLVKSKFDIYSFIVACVIFLIASSPIVDYYFGKKLPWYGVLAIKLLLFIAIYGSISVYVLS